VASLAQYSRLVAAKADVEAHLEKRRGALDSTFAGWGKDDLDAHGRLRIVQDYFTSADIGTPKQVGAGTSVLVKARRTEISRPNVLVLGRHGLDDLGTHQAGDVGDVALHRGPGIASRLGPTLAFCEGAQAAAAAVGEEAVNLSYLSLGDNDTFADVASHIFTGNIDGVFLTDAVSWAPRQPAITTGSRGRVVVELTLTAGIDVADFAVSGALRNPLTKMTQLLAMLRNDRGRIALDGFYDRALRPDDATRGALTTHGHDGNAWAATLPVTPLRGKLSSLERAALWPGVSVLAIESSAVDGRSAPGMVRATVAFYLVPDQRHAEVERSLRAWVSTNAPPDLQPSVHVISSSRPYRSEADSVPVAAQARAAYRLFGREAARVPAGGPAGAGELAYAIGAPVAFAGISPPTVGFGSLREQLDWNHFAAGTAMAAETLLQLRNQ